jgi:multiple sugar transport system substrate-binding protein
VGRFGFYQVLSIKKKRGECSKMIFKKSLLTVFIGILTLSILLSACSSNKDSGTATPTGSTNPATDSGASSKPVKISIWSGYSEMDPWFKKVVDEYKKTNPNVTIEVTSFPLRDYEKKVAASLPSKSAADILTLGKSLATRYIDGGFLQPAPDKLGQFVNSGIYPQLIMDNTQAKDKTTYAVPFMKSASAIYYNKDMLKAAGLTAPPASMDQLTEYAQKLAKKDASGNLTQSGMSLRLSGNGSGVGEKFWNLLAQRGGSFLKEVSPGKYKANYNSEEGYQTLKMYVDMVHKFKTDDAKLKHDTEAFQSQLTAFYVRESNVVIDTKTKAPNLNYGTWPLVANVVDLQNYYVSSQDKDKAAAAWDFIRFLTEPQNQKDMVAMTGWLTPRTDLDMSDLYKQYPQFEGFFPAKQDLQVYPPIAEFDEILTKFADHMANQGYTDASFVDNPAKMKAFLDSLAKETNDILKKAGDLAA